MGWEKRGNREYYYRKERIGGRVVSEYIGTGEAANLIARLDAIKQDQQRLEGWQEKRQRAEIAEIDDQLAELEAIIKAITKGVLLAEGFHTHKRQWRRTRGEHQEVEQEAGRERGSH